MAEVKFINTKGLQDLYQKPNLVMHDIREKDEFTREHIIGAQNTPISKFDFNTLNNLDDKIVVFHCQSGMHTKANMAKFQNLNCSEILILEQGLNEWKKLGCDVAINNKAPLPIMRQVQIVAGLLILIGVPAGFLITPAFFLLSSFVEAGLVFAGVSGSCGMANLLMFLPYNKSNKCNSSCQ